MLPLLDLETVRQRIPIVYKGRIAADDPGLAADTWLETAEWADVNLFLDPLPLGGHGDTPTLPSCLFGDCRGPTNGGAPLATYDALPASGPLPEKAATITHLDLMNALM